MVERTKLDISPKAVVLCEYVIYNKQPLALNKSFCDKSGRGHHYLTFEIHTYDRLDPNIAMQDPGCKTFFSCSSGSVFDKSAIMEFNESVQKGTTQNLL